MIDLAAQLRKAIRRTGQTTYAVAKGSGVSKQRLAAFLAGGSLRLEHASRLVDYLGLELRRRG